MNYDITFCEGDNCARKEQCHRYCELLRYHANNGSKIKPRISILIPDNPENCPLYWAET